MRGRELLDQLWSEGFKIVAFSDDSLTIEPASRLTDELRAEIRATKPELLEELRRRIGDMILEAFVRDLEARR